MEAISATGLRKSYGKRAVLDGVDITFAEGVRVAVYGPTGEGKTTLLYCLAGLLRPDGGRLEIFARSADGNGAWMPPEERDVGMVFQKALLWPHMRVRQNVEYALYGLSLTALERRERACEVLELFGAAELERRRPETLSGGQVQRVALARSIAARPRILLWDEPFTGFDDASREEVARRALRYVTETKTTLVMVSHRMEDAALMDARILRLMDGSLVAEI